jgi:hypothetical protein
MHNSWDLGEKYGLGDVDGRRSHWGRHFATTSPGPTRQA